MFLHFHGDYASTVPLSTALDSLAGSNGTRTLAGGRMIIPRRPGGCGGAGPRPAMPRDKSWKLDILSGSPDRVTAATAPHWPAGGFAVAHHDPSPRPCPSRLSCSPGGGQRGSSEAPGPGPGHAGCVTLLQMRLNGGHCDATPAGFVGPGADSGGRASD